MNVTQPREPRLFSVDDAAEELPTHFAPKETLTINDPATGEPVQLKAQVPLEAFHGGELQVLPGFGVQVLIERGEGRDPFVAVLPVDKMDAVLRIDAPFTVKPDVSVIPESARPKALPKAASARQAILEDVQSAIWGRLNSVLADKRGTFSIVNAGFTAAISEIAAGTLARYVDFSGFDVDDVAAIIDSRMSRHPDAGDEWRAAVDKNPALPQVVASLSFASATTNQDWMMAFRRHEARGRAFTVSTAVSPIWASLSHEAGQRIDDLRLSVSDRIGAIKTQRDAFSKAFADTAREFRDGITRAGRNMISMLRVFGVRIGKVNERAVHLCREAPATVVAGLNKASDLSIKLAEQGLENTNLFVFRQKEAVKEFGLGLAHGATVAVGDALHSASVAALGVSSRIGEVGFKVDEKAKNLAAREKVARINATKDVHPDLRAANNQWARDLGVPHAPDPTEKDHIDATMRQIDEISTRTGLSPAAVVQHALDHPRSNDQMSPASVAVDVAASQTILSDADLVELAEAAQVDKGHAHGSTNGNATLEIG